MHMCALAGKHMTSHTCIYTCTHIPYRYMVDAADHEKLDASKNELHSLLEKPQLAGIPVSSNCISQILLILHRIDTVIDINV